MARKKPLDEVDIPTWLRHLPKVELHLHLEGTIAPVWRRVTVFQK